MRSFRTWQYRVSRQLGRGMTYLAAVITLGRMPPFVSTSALIVNRGRLLVVLDATRHEPILPGGHLKWGEPPLKGLKREVKEETGYDIEPQDLLGAFSGKEEAGELGVVRLVYRAEVAGGVISSSGEGEAKWLAIHEMLSAGLRDGPLVRRLLEEQDQL